MYRAGTLITLRDGKVYRTSKKTVCVCECCIDYYKKHNLRKPCSIFGDTPRPFSDEWWLLNNEKCAEMYGEYQFPKQVFSKSSLKTGL